MAEKTGAFEPDGTLAVDQRFAVVPEWITGAEISDCAFRLYAVLLRYGQTSRQRMPGRALLARRLHKASKDTVDRALRELEAIGAVTVERRRAGQQNLTNRYHLRTRPPGHADQRAGEQQGKGGRSDAATPAAPDAADGGDRGEGGRTDAATPVAAGGRTVAARGGRTGRGRVAAPVRPDPEVLTERTPPPTPPRPESDRNAAPCTALTDADRAVLASCGVRDLDALAARCARLRRQAGRPTAGWSPDRLLRALADAVNRNGRPAALAVPALLAVAADPASHSPARLGCPGPWWTAPDTPSAAPALTSAEVRELDALEVRLREADGRRVWLQQRARADLSDRGETLTRLAVARRACQLLDDVELTPC